MNINPPPPDSAEIGALFHNVDPDVVWGKAMDIIIRISPDYDFSQIRGIFNDVMILFHGDYPGYSAIKTQYHNLPHTLDVLLCSLRLMRGMHVSGIHFSDDDISMVMIATLMHDVGYAQGHDEIEGTGAQFTKFHVARGIAFMHNYLNNIDCPSNYAPSLKFIMRTTDSNFPFEKIAFPDERTRLLGQIVGTADIVGQMADRTYLEKLQYLYQEFKEANLGGFQSSYDLMCKTKSFYEIIREKLDSTYDCLYKNLSFFFLDTMGADNNYYLESIEKNIEYLSKVVALDEEEYLTMLKRGNKV